MYQLHGSLKAVENSGDELARILLKASEVIAKVKGCKLYAISKNSNEQDTIWITEIWDNKESHDKSLESDEVKELIFKAIPLLAETPKKGQELIILGGHGI